MPPEVSGADADWLQGAPRRKRRLWKGALASRQPGGGGLHQLSDEPVDEGRGPAEGGWLPFEACGPGMAYAQAGGVLLGALVARPWEGAWADPQED